MYNAQLKQDKGFNNYLISQSKIFVKNKLQKEMETLVFSLNTVAAVHDK